MEDLWDLLQPLTPRGINVKKPVYGMLLGGILGIFDGLSALVSAPETAPQITGIVVGSTFKGIIAGLLIGLVARKTKSLPVGVLSGLVIGAAFAGLIVFMNVQAGMPAYVWQIMLPGAIVGLIVGYATMKHGEGLKVSAGR
jgi:membrane protease YdiL (CAAX protease family)